MLTIFTATSGRAVPSIEPGQTGCLSELKPSKLMCSVSSLNRRKKDVDEKGSVGFGCWPKQQHEEQQRKCKTLSGLSCLRPLEVEKQLVSQTAYLVCLKQLEAINTWLDERTANNQRRLLGWTDGWQIRIDSQRDREQ